MEKVYLLDSRPMVYTRCANPNNVPLLPPNARHLAITYVSLEKQTPQTACRRSMEHHMSWEVARVWRSPIVLINRSQVTGVRFALGFDGAIGVKALKRLKASEVLMYC